MPSGRTEEISYGRAKLAGSRKAAQATVSESLHVSERYGIGVIVAKADHRKVSRITRYRASPAKRPSSPNWSTPHLKATYFQISNTLTRRPVHNGLRSQPAITGSNSVFSDARKDLNKASALAQNLASRDRSSRSCGVIPQSFSLGKTLLIVVAVCRAKLPKSGRHPMTTQKAMDESRTAPKATATARPKTARQPIEPAALSGLGGANRLASSD